MRESFYLALKYVSFHKVKSIVLVFSIGIIIYLPNGLRHLINKSEEQMMSRAQSTPLIIGSKGSMTDLVINTLYFQQEHTQNITMSEVEDLNATGFGYAIPVHSMFKARTFPIVGTDPDYFQFRNLQLESGEWMGFVGQCVIGNVVADQLVLGVGDSIISSTENLFDLAGVYPLKMKIVGVLQSSNSPDDRAIFVDNKTNWVIMGLGHGHEDLINVADPSIVIQRDSGEIKASAKLMMYNTIDGDNMDSFHFHGDQSKYPISSIIYVPKDFKSSTLLRGRFETGQFDEQIVVPQDVIQNLLQSIFRIKQIFNTVFILVGFSTLLILAMIVALSVRLRKNEIYTMFTIGSSKWKVVEIVVCELLILAGSSAIFALTLYGFTGIFVDDFINRFII